METELSVSQISKKILEEDVYIWILHKELILKEYILISESDGNFKVHRSFDS